MCTRSGVSFVANDFSSNVCFNVPYVLFNGGTLSLRYLRVHPFESRTFDLWYFVRLSLKFYSYKLYIYFLIFNIVLIL